MTQQHRFLRALRYLCDWYADSVKAQAFTGLTTSSVPGSRPLRAQQYPHLRDWLHDWRRAGDDYGALECVIEGIEVEVYSLGVAPSRKHEEHVNTAPWKRAIAETEGSTRQVARLFGVSKSTVARYRKEFVTS